jgi:hypothetical protein
MSNLAKIEKKVMNLAPEEREHLALSAWESLGDGSDPAINKHLDPEGIEIAKKRDLELSSGAVKPISHSEFLRRISTSE